MYIPGIIAFLIGFIVTASLSMGPYWIGPIRLDLHWMLLGMTMTTVGYSAIQFALLAKVYYNFDPKISQLILKIFSYNRGTFTGIFMIIFGLMLDLFLLYNWIENELMLNEISYSGVLGLIFMILGFQTFTFTLILHMIWQSKEGN